jgi:hypothetical protein
MTFHNCSTICCLLRRDVRSPAGALLLMIGGLRARFAFAVRRTIDRALQESKRAGGFDVFVETQFAAAAKHAEDFDESGSGIGDCTKEARRRRRRRG